VSLDLAQIAIQIDSMAAKLQASEEERKQKLDFALNTLRSQSANLASLKRKIETGKTTWLVAGIEDKLDAHYPAPPSPEDFIVLATDGSHIDVDRHRSARCFVINIGIVRLNYGQTPSAFLSSLPMLHFKEEDVVLSSTTGSQQETIEGSLLGVKRSVEECHLLAELAKEVEANLPTVALLDGSLVLWGLAGQVYPAFVADALLENGLLKHLEELRQLSKGRQLALASYISFPRSTEVVNVLRLALCPYEPVDCDRYCASKTKERDCDNVAGLLDRELFEQLLTEGECSALFSSHSSIVKEHYREHQIYFFYVKTAGELVRVEVPQWVAEGRRLLDITHTIILDQCRRGQGYPVALSEAHEKAVITAADRDQFWQLVERSLARQDRMVKSSAKAKSKRMRWI